jgi:hypothetical protein
MHKGKKKLQLFLKIMSKLKGDEIVTFGNK